MSNHNNRCSLIRFWPTYVALIIILLSLFGYPNQILARKLVPLNDETRLAVENELTEMVQNKEWDAEKSLSLYKCYGKIYGSSDNDGLGTIKKVLEKQDVVIERSKYNKHKKRFYIIVSMLGLDGAELKRILASLVGETTVVTDRVYYSTIYKELELKHLGCSRPQLY